MPDLQTQLDLRRQQMLSQQLRRTDMDMDGGPMQEPTFPDDMNMTPQWHMYQRTPQLHEMMFPRVTGNPADNAKAYQDYAREILIREKLRQMRVKQLKGEV